MDWLRQVVLCLLLGGVNYGEIQRVTFAEMREGNRVIGTMFKNCSCSLKSGRIQFMTEKTRLSQKTIVIFLSMQGMAIGIFVLCRVGGPVLWTEE